MKEDEPKPATVSLWAIFKVFSVIGVTAFGGGASAHIYDAVVGRRQWIDEKRFLEGMTLARIIPGTNVSNLAPFVGSMLAGYRGAAVAVVAVVVPGVIAVLSLAVAYMKFAEHSRHIQTSLHGLTAGAVGIMTSLVINAIEPAFRSRAGLVFGGLAFAGVGLLQLNMLWVLAVLLPLASFVNRTETR